MHTQLEIHIPSYKNAHWSAHWSATLYLVYKVTTVRLKSNFFFLSIHRHVILQTMYGQKKKFLYI